MKHAVFLTTKFSRLFEFSTGPVRVKNRQLTRIYANEENVAQCISIQSAHMLSMFEHFPEVLLVDATHDSNSSNYKLFSFMVNDAMGKVSMYSAALLNMSGKRSCGLPVVSLRIVIHPMIL
ncbi:hypothetical protein PC123_g7564 [Phytophthora cactorum]|nr:hypothetical protein PC123_g7564 [Phytophthora cactorum]